MFVSSETSRVFSAVFQDYVARNQVDGSAAAALKVWRKSRNSMNKN